MVLPEIVEDGPVNILLIYCDEHHSLGIGRPKHFFAADVRTRFGYLLRMTYWIEQSLEAQHWLSALQAHRALICCRLYITMHDCRLLYEPDQWHVESSVVSSRLLVAYTAFHRPNLPRAL